MQTTNQSTMFCTKCGNKNNSINLYCYNCGNEFIRTTLDNISSKNINVKNTNDYKKISDIDTNNIDTNDIERFVSKNVHYYNEKFNKINSTGSKITWNWAAFFLNIFWMLYRKMYIQAGVLFLVNAVISAIPYLGFIVSIGLAVAIGMYSNSLYLDHIQKKLVEMQNLDYNMRESMIIKKGGTNLALPLIIVGISVLAILMLIFFFSVAIGSMFY